jgi:hypothetical protein
MDNINIGSTQWSVYIPFVLLEVLDEKTFNKDSRSDNSEDYDLFASPQTLRNGGRAHNLVVFVCSPFIQPFTSIFHSSRLYLTRRLHLTLALA